MNVSELLFQDVVHFKDLAKGDVFANRDMVGRYMKVPLISHPTFSYNALHVHGNVFTFFEDDDVVIKLYHKLIISNRPID